MNSPTDAHEDPCLSEEALEEYAMQQRLAAADQDMAGAAETGDHVRDCPACRSRLAEIRTLIGSIQNVLSPATDEAEPACPEAEELALYLDQALDPSIRAQVQHHLARCRPCRRKLVELYRELQAVMSTLASSETPADTISMAEIKAKLAVRAERADSTPPQERGAGGAESPTDRSGGDELEERKKRYSSPQG
jgi:anti-sigma factor RsiW